MAIPETTNVYVAWAEHTSFNETDILFKRSTDNGASFGQTINLSSGTGNSFAPIAVIPETTNVYVAWHDKTTGGDEIFFTKFPSDYNHIPSFKDESTIDKNNNNNNNPIPIC